MYLQIDIQCIYYIYTILNIFLAFPIQAPVQPPTLEDAQAKLCCRTCVNLTKGHKKDSEVSTESKVEFNTYYIVYNNSI